MGISRCIIHALEKLEVPIPDVQKLRDWIGPSLMQSFALYFEQTGAGDAGLALDYYRDRFKHTGLFENTVYEGVPELLSALAGAGHVLLLATAKPTVYASRIVEHFGMGQWLRHSYGSELDGSNTDKVDLLQHIIKEEQLDPANCVMVGDRKHDMHAARYHGMRSIGVLWGYGSKTELLDAGAEHLAESPHEILGLL